MQNNILKNKIIKRGDLLSVRPENKFDIWNLENYRKKIKKNYKKSNNRQKRFLNL